MSHELLAALLVFVVVTLFTPGPNNLMLMASGLTFGFRGAQPHVWGVTIGFSVMVLLVGLGLGAVFAAVPILYTVLKYAGAAYLVYLAFVIARSGPVRDSGEGRSRPIGFLEAAAFQWINPKGWVMAVGGISTYGAILAFPLNSLLISALFGAFGVFSCWSWVLFGSGLRRFLTNPRAVRIFNVAMALALVASLIPVFVEG
jgi:threonine/homoserine/homoserine lactone efflux protein